MKREKRRAIQAFISVLVLAPVYVFWVLKKGAPVVIHCAFLFFILVGVVEFVSYRLRLKHPVMSRHEMTEMENFRVSKTIEDEVIGKVELVETEDDYRWQCSIGDDVDKIIIKVAGKEEPDPNILIEVRRLKTRFHEFKTALQSFLESEAAGDPENSKKILSLKPEYIGFYSSDRPRFADIIFRADAEGRIWACGYDSGRLYNLSVS